MRWLIVTILTLLLAGACGGDKKTPAIGTVDDNNRDEDAGARDTGDETPRPDAGNNTPIGDAGADTNVAPPDMTVPPDLGHDTGPIDMAPNCPRMNVQYNGACRCNQECVTGVCIGATTTVDGSCSRECDGRDDCPDGDACVTDRFGVSVCRADDTGDDCTAADGEPDPASCSAGHCLEAGSNFSLDHFCSVPCETAADCRGPGSPAGTGYACSPVRCRFGLDGYRCLPTITVQRAANTEDLLATYSESTKLCVRIGDPNPCGDVTMASDEQACRGAMCDANPVGRCTAACEETADCQAGGCVLHTDDPALPVRVCDL